MAKNKGNGATDPRGIHPGRETDKQKAIALAVSSIEKQFGKGSILKMTQDGVDREIQSF